MDRQKNAAPTDFDLLNQLKILSFLDPRHCTSLQAASIG